MKLTVFLTVITVSFAWGAGSNDDDCRRKLADLVSRAPISHHTLRTQLETIIDDDLILQLEVEHLLRLRDNHVESAKDWRVFNPIWILDSPTVLEQVLDYFDPQDPSAGPRVTKGFTHWITKWEKIYEKHLGKVAKSWSRNHHSGRRRFLRRLLVEGAVRHALREDLGDNPDIFTTDPRSGSHFINVLTSDVLVHFADNLDAFRKSFDATYRRMVGSSVPQGAPVPVIESRLRQALRAVGVQTSRIQNWRPRVSADFRQRRNKTEFELLMEAIKYFEDSDLPLVGLFVVGTEGAQEVQDVQIWQTVQMLGERYGSIESLLRRVNNALTEDQYPQLVPREGCQNLTQELVVEAGLIYLAELGSLRKDFSGFQAQEPDEPLFLNMDHDLIRASHLTLFQINDLIRARLR